MKKIFLVFFIVLFSILSSEPIAVIAGMKGDISLTRDNKKIAVKTGELLLDSDQLLSGSESFAAIRFIDNGATTKLFPNSVLIIYATSVDGQLSKRNNLRSGKIHSNVNPLSGQYIVETPNTVASVRGTDFTTEYENNITTIDVNEGEVEIESKLTGEKERAYGQESYSVNQNGQIEKGVYNPDSDSEPDTLDAENFLEIEVINNDGVIKKVRINYE